MKLFLILCGFISIFIIYSNSSDNIEYSFQPGIIEGWSTSVALPNRYTGGEPNDYEFGIDKLIYHTSPRSFYIRQLENNSTNGILFQTISAKNYLNKKISFSGYLKGANNISNGWLYMQANADDKTLRAGSNFSSCIASSENKWKKCKLVIHIPNETKTITYGAIASEGIIWVDDLEITIVAHSVQEDGIYFPPNAQSKNLP